MKTKTQLAVIAPTVASLPAYALTIATVIVSGDSLYLPLLVTIFAVHLWTMEIAGDVFDRFQADYVLRIVNATQRANIAEAAVKNRDSKIEALQARSRDAV